MSRIVDFLLRVWYIALMRIYNALGYAALGFQLVLSAWLAPPSIGPWWGMAIGFGYLLMSWFLAGVYLSDVMHMGITHGALDYKEWFIKGRDAGQQHRRRLRRSGQLGQSSPVASSICGPRTAIRTSSTTTASGERCTSACFPTHAR